MTTVLRCFNVPDVFETVPSPNGILPIAVAKHVLSTKDEDILPCRTEITQINLITIR
jgi:hypothetical protein